MDMDPTAPAFQRLANNVFAFTAFKSTEPYLEEYAALNVQEVARRAGFSEVDTRQGPPVYSHLHNYAPQLVYLIVHNQ